MDQNSLPMHSSGNPPTSSVFKFTKTVSDYSFVKKKKRGYVTVILYLDDIIIKDNEK